MLKLCQLRIITVNYVVNKANPKLFQSTPLKFNPVSNVHTKKRIFIPPPIRAPQNNKKITPLGWCLLAVPVTSFALGCWQVKRKSWKESLVRELESKLKLPPTPLPDNLADLETMEYQPVLVRGKFLHEGEMRLGPRGMLTDGDSTTSGGLLTQKQTSIGFLIITPFQLEGREEKILINRGWVPKQLLDPATRAAGQVKGTVELVGIVRSNEVRPQFTPAQRGEIFMYRDIHKMNAMTGTEPVFLDADADSTISGGPIGGQTRATLRNEHLSYIFTWFSLSGFTSWMWFQKVVKRGI